MNELSSILSQLHHKVLGWAKDLVLLLPNLTAALVVFAIAWLLSRAFAGVTVRLLAYTSTHETLKTLIYRFVRAVVIGTGLVVSLQILQLEKAATTFLAGAGIIGLALGLAFQDLTANFIAGVVMAMRRPMQVGDLVETNGVFGRVENVHLRSTFLRRPDGVLVIIPNRKIFEEALVNYTDLGKLRVDVDCGISYSEDLRAVQETVLTALGQVPRHPSEDVEFYFRGFGESSINFTVRFWIPYRKPQDQLAAQSAAVMAIKRAFDNRGITIPFPIRTLNFAIQGGQSLGDQLRPLLPSTDKERGRGAL